MSIPEKHAENPSVVDNFTFADILEVPKRRKKARKNEFKLMQKSEKISLS